MAELKIIEKAGAVIKHSSSLRFIELTVAISLLDMASNVLPYVGQWLPFDQSYLTGAASISGSIAWVCRLIAQKKIGASDAS